MIHAFYQIDQSTSEKEILEFMNRRRHQILVHSVIYYHFNNSVISDYQWAEWAKDLELTQKKYPELAKRGKFAKAFEEFDASTGAFFAAQ